MFHGRNNGKKLMAVRIIEHAFEIIHLLTDENPIQVFVKAIVAAGPREDSTRIGAAGIVRRQAVDVSPFRRVNQAIYLISIGVRLQSAALLCCSCCTLSMRPHHVTPCFVFLHAPLSLFAFPQAREASFRTIKTIAECLADEIVNASKVTCIVPTRTLMPQLAHPYTQPSLRFALLSGVTCLHNLQGSSSSYAIKKKDELERVAKSNR